MAKVQLNCRIEESVRERILELAVKPATQADVIAKAIAALDGQNQSIIVTDPARAVERREPVDVIDHELDNWMQGELARLSDEYSIDHRAALYMVFDFYRAMGGQCPACSRGDSGELAIANEPGPRASTSSVAANTLVPMSPAGLHALGEVRCSCAHCGQPYVAARLGNLCPGCFREGHRGDVRDCPACGTGSGL